MIFGDSGFSRSGGAENRVKHFSQSSHKGGASYVFKGIYRYLDVFIAIYGYLFFIYLYLKKPYKSIRYRIICLYFNQLNQV